MGIAIGQIIGAGVMTMTGTAIGMTGTGVALAFIISPIITLITDFPQAILGSSVPVSGGPYRYISRLWGKQAGFLYIVLFVLTNVNLSMYALSFGSYAVSLFTGLGQNFVAAVILTVMFIVNILGTKKAAVVNTLVSVVMIGSLLAFAAFGLPQADLGYVFTPSNLFDHGPMGLISAIALLGFATSGAANITQLGSEAKDPARDIPRVIVISTILCAFVYIAVAITACGVLPIQEVADQNLTLVASKVLPGPLYYVFVVGAALGATASTLNSTLSWVVKPILVACDDGMLPSALGSVNSKGVPWKLLIGFYIFGMLPIVTGVSFATIARLSTAINLIIRIMTITTLFHLQKKYPASVAKSTLPIPPSLYKPWAIFASCISLVLAYSLVYSLTPAILLALGCIVAAAILYATFGLKNVVIPDDLDVDYIAAAQAEDQQPPHRSQNQ